MRVILCLLLISALIGSPIPPPSPHTGAFRGAPFLITVQLQSQSGNPIDNASILFFHETQNEYLGNAITNITGHGKFIWQIPSTQDLGPIQLNATYRGDPERYLLPSVISIPLTIFAQIRNNISVKDSDGNQVTSVVDKGQRLFFHVLILNDQMSPLEGIRVQLLQEPNQLITEGLSAQNGSIILDCIVNYTMSSDVTFIVRSLSSGYYNGTAQSFQFSLNKFSSRFIGLHAFWNPSYDPILCGKLCLLSGEGISNASVELLHKNKSVISIVKTDEDGNFQFNVSKISRMVEKNRYVILRYNGTLDFSTNEAVIGIIPGSSINPFEQFGEHTPLEEIPPLLQQIGIIVIGGIAIATAFLTIKMKRTTSRIVSH